MDKIRPYSGVRILDMCHDLGSYATKLFADLGAEVIRVEPPDGLPDRRRVAAEAKETQDRYELSSFEFKNSNKKSISIDFDDDGGLATFSQLAATAQIIILETSGPLYDRIDFVKETAPRSVITVVSPFGMDKPVGEFQSSNDLILQAAGGIAYLSGRQEDSPLSLPQGQVGMVASVYAASATAIALADLEQRNRGHVVDVSAQECIAHSLQNAIQVWDLEKKISTRGGVGTKDASEDIFECSDGYVFLASPPTLGVSWKSLIAWMREQEAPEAEEFAKERWLDRGWRLTEEAHRLFRRHFEPFSRRQSKQTLLDEAIKRKIVMSPVAKVADLFDDAQLRHREFFRAVSYDASGVTARAPGAPYKLSVEVWTISQAPQLGAHTGDIEALLTNGSEAKG
ncbi:CoA transferase [Aurantimonas sp. C2-5-R2]|uniref:CoA transferase n=1 Tax=Aurantimonas sp. C2-5-R2 TaxID=3113713 RepID=UPI002F9302A9